MNHLKLQELELTVNISSSLAFLLASLLCLITRKAMVRWCGNINIKNKTESKHGAALEHCHTVYTGSIALLVTDFIIVMDVRRQLCRQTIDMLQN